MNCEEDTVFRREPEKELYDIEWTLKIIYREQIFTNEEIRELTKEQERIKMLLSILK